MEVPLELLQDFVNKIVREYQTFLKNKFDATSVRTAIGLQISAMKRYEIKDGVYPLRSITVIPNSSRIIDLLLIYNSQHGFIKLELNIKPADGKNFTIVKKMLSAYDESEEYCTDSTLNLNFTLRKVPKHTRETSSKSGRWICATKDTNCCHLKKNHDESKCRSCCYGQDHYPV